MTNEVKNVPEIRFPEFDDEWKEKKFYECVEIEGKLVNPNFHEYQNLPHIGPGNIQKNTGRILNYNLVKDENLISGKFEFEEEDIIYGKINPQLQKICIPGFRGLASADTYPIKTISGVSNTYFIYYSLFTSRFFKYSVSVSMRTGMPKINKEELGSYNFYLPKIMEQQKIGGFFSKLDRQIELEEQKLEKLEEQKKGYMQKIFSQELRFKDENGDDYTEWEKKELGDILTILDGDRGGNYPHSTDFSVQGHTLFLSATNVTKKGFSFKQNQYITEKKSNSMGKGKLVENDIILTTRGSLGNIAWYNKEISKLIPFVRINSGMLILRTNDTRKSIFVTQILKSPLGKRQIDLISFGSAQPQLTKKDVKSYKINLPETKEQQKIGDFFSELDKLVEKQSAKLNRLKVRKQGFLQKMFV